MSFPCGSMLKNLPANAGDTGDTDSTPGSGRSQGGGNGNPVHYSCLENPMDRGAWWATFCGVTQSQIPLSRHTRRTAVIIMDKLPEVRFYTKWEIFRLILKPVHYR